MMYALSPPAPIESKKTENEFTRLNVSRYSPSATTPMSSAANPIFATRASMWVPLKLTANASSSSATAVPNWMTGVCSIPKSDETKPPPNSATAVTVTMTAQMYTQLTIHAYLRFHSRLAHG